MKLAELAFGVAKQDRTQPQENSHVLQPQTPPHASGSHYADKQESDYSLKPIYYWKSNI